MIIFTNINEFDDFLDKVSLLFPYRKMHGHLEGLHAVMLSEDGTNFIQGLASAEMYATKRGVCCKLQGIWIAPECRSIGFGKALLENVEMKASEIASLSGKGSLAVITGLIPVKDVETKSFFENLGYVIETKGKNFLVSKEMVDL